MNKRLLPAVLSVVLMVNVATFKRWIGYYGPAIAGCPTDLSAVDLYSNTNCSGTSVGAPGPGLYDLGGFSEKAQSIAIPSSWSVVLYKDPSTSGPGVCVPATTSDLSAFRYSDGSTATQSATWLKVYGQPNCPGFFYAPPVPSDPQPPGNPPLARTSDITLSWSTYASSCDVQLWGGNMLQIYPSSMCAPVHVGTLYAGSYHWQVTAHNIYTYTVGPIWDFGVQPYPPTVVRATTAQSAAANPRQVSDRQPSARGPTMPTTRTVAAPQAQINLSWTLSNDDPGNVDSYKVYTSGGYLMDAAAGSTGVTLNGLACGTSYTLYVTAVRQGVESVPSNQATTSTPPCTVLLTSVWTTDGNGNLKSDFAPHEQIMYWGDVVNQIPVTQTVTFTWTVNGPCGPLELLPVARDTAAGDQWWELPRAIPAHPCAGSYTYQLAMTFLNTTTTLSTTFTVSYRNYLSVAVRGS